MATCNREQDEIMLISAFFQWQQNPSGYTHVGVQQQDWIGENFVRRHGVRLHMAANSREYME